jgi:hypothetical protein
LYQRGTVTGTARAEHRFAPQVEHRMRRATSTSRASHPQMRAIMFGVVRRSRRHDSHFRMSTYWPNSSDSFFDLEPHRQIVASLESLVHQVVGDGCVLYGVQDSMDYAATLKRRVSTRGT